MVCHGWTVAKYCPAMLVSGRNRLQVAWILDGHSQASRDGFMASRETREADTGFNAED